MLSTSRSNNRLFIAANPHLTGHTAFSLGVRVPHHHATIGRVHSFVEDCELRRKLIDEVRRNVRQILRTNYRNNSHVGIALVVV